MEHSDGNTSLEALMEVAKVESSGRIYLGKFYCMVVHMVLLFGSETWVLIAALMQKLKSLHVIFLRHMTGKKDRSLGNKTWR